MNLVLSPQAAYTAPMIKMSQNRQATRDRIEVHIDYEINPRAEIKVLEIMENLATQNSAF